MSKKIIFFGNERFATGVSTKLLVIKELVSLDYQIVAIVLSQKIINHKSKKDNLEIEDFANSNNIPIIYFENNDILYNKLLSIQTDFGLLASYGRIIPTKILGLFKGGIINIHPSLLPKHRGPTPLESVILSGETNTGVSIIKLVKEMDEGPIYYQEKIAINPLIHKQELADLLDELASHIIKNKINDITSLKLSPTNQDNGLASYDKTIIKEDSILDPTLKTALELERQIRAHEIWPKSILEFNNLKLIILKAHVLNENSEAGHIYLKDQVFGVYCKQGLLIIDELLPLGKNKMTSAAFLAGYRHKLI